MFALLLIIAGAGAVYTAPMPRPHLAEPERMQVVSADPAAPAGLPWQQVIAPYLQQPPQVSTWARQGR